MIDWSYNLLNAHGRAVFCRLGVFAGGATLGAIQTVMEIDGDLAAPVIDVLAGLVAKSLIQRDEVGGESRCGMLATLREYALPEFEAVGALGRALPLNRAFALALGGDGVSTARRGTARRATEVASHGPAAGRPPPGTPGVGAGRCSANGPSGAS
jgi:predicted ATPase